MPRMFNFCCQRIILVCFAGFVLSGCENNLNWATINPTNSYGRDNLIFLFSGLNETVEVSLSIMVLCSIFGVILATLSFSHFGIIRFAYHTMIHVLRSIPAMVILLWVYYGLPVLFELRLNIFWSSVLALSIAEVGFFSEAVRSGIRSLGTDQIDAGKSLGLRKIHIFVHIILPQAIRVIMPTLMNQYIYILKLSSIASIIGMTELTRRANELVTVEYRPLEIYSFLILEYIILIVIMAKFIDWMEKRFF